MSLGQGIIAPMIATSELQGLLVVSGIDLGGADAPAVTTFASQAAIALENARLFEQVQVGREQLSRLTQQVVSAQEEERHRLSRELHDEMGQTLTMMSINLTAVENELASELSPTARHRLEETNSLADQLLEQVRDLSLDLRPPMLDDFGLISALRWYASRYGRRLNIKVELQAIDLQERLLANVETALYRITQEALTNVARHAQASKVSLRLERRGSSVAAFIEDDGRGFDVAQLGERDAAPPGVGVLGMQERVSSLGGRFSIESSPGHGTRLAIEIPISDC